MLNCQKHVSPKFFNYHKYLEATFKPNVHQDEFFRSNSCAILFNQNFSTSCSSCHSHCIKLTSEANRKQANLDKPAKLYAPVTHTNPVKLKLALQEHRLQCKQLESELVHDDLESGLKLVNKLTSDQFCNESPSCCSSFK